MVFFPIYRYHQHNHPLDRYFDDQHDFFDPWHDLNTSPTTLFVIPNTFQGIHKLQRADQATTTDKHANRTVKALNSEKFRVQLNVAGFNPETIKTKVENGKIIVEAKQENREINGDFNIRELRKSYPLPEHADATHLISFITPNKVLAIEVPIRNPEVERRLAEAMKRNQNLAQFGQYRDPLFDYESFLRESDCKSRIVDKGDNQKQLEILIAVKNYKQDEIKMSVKENDLIIKGERQHQDGNSIERSFFFKSITLPPGTQVQQLKSQLTDDGQLKIDAPFVELKKATNPVEQNEVPKSIKEQQN